MNKLSSKNHKKKGGKGREMMILFILAESVKRLRIRIVTFIKQTTEKIRATSTAMVFKKKHENKDGTEINK